MDRVKFELVPSQKRVDLYWVDTKLPRIQIMVVRSRFMGICCKIFYVSMKNDECICMKPVTVSSEVDKNNIVSKLKGA